MKWLSSYRSADKTGKLHGFSAVRTVIIIHYYHRQCSLFSSTLTYC